MHSTTSLIVGLAILACLAVIPKAISAFIIYRHKEISNVIRFVLLSRYAVFFICAPIFLAELFLPSRLHSTIVELIAGGILGGAWLISIPILQVALKRERASRQQSGTPPPVANLSPKA
jgi:hypothetical protein